MKKRLAILALACAMTTSVLSGCGGKMDNDAVVATVGEEEISVGLANFYARMTQAQYETYYAGYLGDDMWTGEASEGKTYQESVKEQILEDLENMVLSRAHMEEYDVKLSDEEKTAIEEAAKSFNDANEFEDKDKVSGEQEIVEEFLTLYTIRQKVETAIKDAADAEVSDEEAAQKSMQYVLFANTGVDEETGSATPLTDEEVEQRKEDAQKFAKEVKADGEFETLAESYGVEVKTATFNVNREASVPEEIVKAADALKEGEVTDAVETENGYYIAKVTSLYDEEATKSEKETMIAEKQQEAYDKILEGWREEAKISVDKKVWKKVDFTTLTVSMKIDETDAYSDKVQTDDQAEGAEAEASE